MSHNSSRPSMFPFQAQAELELLHLMLQSESEQTSREALAEPYAVYPWNPASVEAEAYFEALEQEVIKAGWSSDDLAEQGQRLSNSLDQIWAEPVAAPAQSFTVQSSSVQSSSVQISSAVLRQFAAQVPPQILAVIVQKAQQVVTTNLTLADQIVQCVQACLPNWGEEDLQVLARPFAYAMRGSETDLSESALRSVRCADWTELSGIEQARLSLAVARYAIAQTLEPTSGPASSPALDPTNLDSSEA